MFKQITDRTKYIPFCEVSKLPIVYDDKMKVNLFGKNILLERNEWLWHLHIKVTDVCNARCDFCIEKNCSLKEKPNTLLTNVDKMLKEMQKNGCLFSVSVTGGEPTLFPRFVELCEILRRYDIKFLTMNSNGAFIHKYIEQIDGLFDFINISRHSIYDDVNNRIFKTSVKTINELKELKNSLKHTKLRIQCVIGNEVNTIDDLENFISTYDFADDLSFRRLMETNEEYGLDYIVDNDSYFSMLKYAFDNWKFKEQTIQDYYVYEIYNNGRTDITFSYSDMKMLRTIEKQESEDVFREFICHPDGLVSGSWKKDCKLIIW